MAIGIDDETRPVEALATRSEAIPHRLRLRLVDEERSVVEDLAGRPARQLERRVEPAIDDGDTVPEPVGEVVVGPAPVQPLFPVFRPDVDERAGGRLVVPLIVRVAPLSEPVTLMCASFAEGMRNPSAAATAKAPTATRTTSKAMTDRRRRTRGRGIRTTRSTRSTRCWSARACPGRSS